MLERWHKFLVQSPETSGALDMRMLSGMILFLRREDRGQAKNSVYSFCLVQVRGGKTWVSSEQISGLHYRFFSGF